MRDLHYLPLFIDDYEGATAHLSIEEDGAYLRLLRICWRQPDCTIPDDKAWIMRRMRCDEATYDRVVAVVIDEFFTRSRGRIWQKRLRDEHARVMGAIERRKEAGSRGGNAKALKTNDIAPSKATILPEKNSSKTVASISIPNPEVKVSLANASESRAREADWPDRAFEDWYGRYPHKVGRAAAERHFRSIRQKRMATFDELVTGLDRYIREKPPDRPWCNPATWLNQHRWKDEPSIEIEHGKRTQQTTNNASRSDAIVAGMARAFGFRDGPVAGPTHEEIPHGRFEIDG